MGNIYKEGVNRKEQLLFPPSIEEYVSKDNIVRVIDEYVELLDTKELGFTKSDLKSIDGRPAYHPKLLLKIYIYGYLNKIRSSRKLEKEINRNIEMMWLCSGLSPSNKTISNFRKENSKALKRVFREFVLLLKNLELITGELVAIDGAFLRANASKNRLISKKSIEYNIKEIDQKIDNYLTTLNYADENDKKERYLTPKVDKLTNLKRVKAKLDKELAFLKEKNLTQYNTTDPDAKLMVKPSHNLIAFNTQIASDSKFKFIVATNISSQGNDSKQLHTMANKTKEIIQNDNITITADKGYFSANEIKKCIDDNIDIVVPIINRDKAYDTKEKFGKDKFIYNKDKDIYICPNKKELKPTGKVKIRGEAEYINYAISSTICKSCPLKDKCLSKRDYKEILRYKYSDIIDEYKEKLKSNKSKEIIKKRGSIVEHIFGTIKQSLGWNHYLVRGKEKVSGENALIMFVYNFRRLFNLIGITLFRKLIIAIKKGNLEEIKAEIVAYISIFLDIWLNIREFFRFSNFGGEKLFVRRDF